jgi:hypothetical protein
MIKYNLKLILQSNNLPETVTIKDRFNDLQYQTVNDQLIIDTYINLPNRVTISLDCTAPGQHLELKEFWLGGVQLDTDILFSVSQYHIATQVEPIFNIFYDQTGQIQFDLFDTNPITYHLHWKNKIRGLAF